MQRDELKEKQRMKKEGIEPTGGDSDGEQGAGDDDGDEGHDDDLFGDEGGMDIG